MSLESFESKYLDMSDNDIDNLLLGINLNIDNTKSELKNDNMCKKCNEEYILETSSSLLVCRVCGDVKTESYNEIPEFNNDLEGTSRYGCPSNYFYPKSALGTKMRCKNGRYNRIGNMQSQGQMPYREKSLLETLQNKIQKKCKKYGITQSIVDSAKILYKKITDCKHKKGKRQGKNRIMRCSNLLSMIAACVFYACKLQGEPRSPKEIADIYDLEIKNVNKGTRRFLEYIDINTLNIEFNSSKSSDFIERFASKLNLDDQYIKIANDISSNIHKLDIASTHEPPSVAAGCILLVSVIYNLNITKKQISEVFKISDVTISKTYRRIYPFHNIIMYNMITDLVLEKRNTMPKKKSDITAENLILKKKDNIKKKEKSKEYLSESDSSNESDIDV